jgi:hypothetical protein
MAKREKDRGTNNDLQNIHKTKDRVTRTIAIVYSSNAGYVSFLILRVCVILIVEKPTVKCSITIKAPFLYSSICLMLF